ncbi:hypothetical protein [Streptomyces microflavus]|uniref:hypothetical protein n=1 Tax=Streptomyces microflavus TaxID=1919 RepID=UPI0037F29720
MDRRRSGADQFTARPAATTRTFALCAGRRTQGSFRAIGEGRLIILFRSPGSHRRYSFHQLRIAARARELVGTPIDAASRIVNLEDELEEAKRVNADYRRATQPRPSPSSSGPQRRAGPDRTSVWFAGERVD